MATWTSDELKKIDKTEELDIQSLQTDGKLRKPVTIWVVRVGDDLFVRSVNGRKGVWFSGTQDRHQGHISCGGVEKDVTFEDANPAVNEQVDDAFHKKYGHYSKNIINTEFTARARESTLRLVPR